MYIKIQHRSTFNLLHLEFKLERSTLIIVTCHELQSVDQHVRTGPLLQPVNEPNQHIACGDEYFITFLRSIYHTP